MKDIAKMIQDGLDENDDGYILKTDEQIIDIIINFGNGETEFHTADIERLIREKQQLEKQVEIYEISIIGMSNTPAEEKFVIGKL
jgi:hypothetical protein